ncbi:hypothetical protein [Myxococcus landrumensis]|uniref:Zinc-finger domain-containing protein n=1 Tax=Myxococcus landrumensis TaxID=2813577 RepID=A0ABX7N8X3_9BACT|nr:hypothetical protein [Myxococcus landrumus]QSQ15093.1 hypothetical protein JY572_03120 [Myxococcus landrumus]
MRCHEVATALLGDSPAWPRDVRAHLDGCEDCRALASAHAAAASLRAPQPPPLPRVSREAVLGEVRRRKVRRRVALGAVASLCVGFLTWMARPGEPSPESPSPYEVLAELPEDTPPASPHELSLRGEPPQHRFDEDPRGSLAVLVAEVRGYSRREVVYGDDTYKPFGTLAAWLRPPDSRALETPPFRTAVIPLIHSQELMP